MHPFPKRIYEAGCVVGRSGQRHLLQSSVDSEEGELLSSIIQEDLSIVKTLEVGCAFGLSSLFICTALQGRARASHTILDPFQSTYWDSVGVMNLEEVGIDFFKLIEVPSEFALPQILQQQGEGSFDLIFVDGMHTFDHTLLDCFYATRLLRINGYLVVDDVNMPSVRRAVNFLRNYPCYHEYKSIVDAKTFRGWKQKVLRSVLALCNRDALCKIMSWTNYLWYFENVSTRMVALKKLQTDQRSWDWHDDRF